METRLLKSLLHDFIVKDDAKDLAYLANMHRHIPPQILNNARDEAIELGSKECLLFITDNYLRMI